MESGLDIVRLSDLFANLHEITHLHISLHDTTGVELYAVQARSSFCELICSEEEGYRRCIECDKQAAKRAASLMEHFEYRCHAGLIDSIVPIAENGQAVALVFFGQILNDSSLIAQWEVVRELCTWHPQQEALKEAFLRLPRLTARQIHASYEMINACVSEIRLEGMLRAETQSDQERLEAYIKTQYASPLTAESIANALSVSRSKLYMMVAQMDEGLTINQMITKQRVTVAKQLLEKPGASVRDVADMVGIPDYNYFTKVFKRAAGVTPSEYRRGLRC